MTTISKDYLVQQKQLHGNDRYGIASLSYAPLIIDILEVTGYRTVCDYGAGKCRLGAELKKKIKSLEYFPVDPAFPEYGVATSAEFVACIDVLEHIEPEYLDSVIAELAKVTNNIGLFSVHTGPARKFLADGRNAHLIQQPASWWLNKLLPYFDIIQLTPVKRGFWVIVQPKGADHAHLLARKPEYRTVTGKLKRWFRRLLKPL